MALGSRWPTLGDMKNASRKVLVSTVAAIARVSANLSDGGYGQRSIHVTFTNWNFWGTQRYGVQIVVCHTPNLVGL